MSLADDDLEKWEYKEHSKVKHEILSKYIGAWMNILGQRHNLNIFDCFAGRGRYSKEEEGSPLIIIRTMAEVKEKMGQPKEACCIFIEKNKKNFKNLKSEIEKEIKTSKKYEGWLDIEYHNKEFVNVAKEIIKKHGKKLAPSFFFIDPFGFSGIPLEIIKDILSIQKTEVFITFMIRDVNRFLEKHKFNIEKLYGIKNVPKELDSERYKEFLPEQALLKLYRDNLHKIANIKYTLPFKVNADKMLKTTYYLIHLTNSPVGCELMKEIMYKVGTTGRFGYLGPAEGQMTLIQVIGLDKLKEFLLNKFKGQTLSFKEIRYKTLMDTEFVKKDYREVLLALEKEKKISIIGKGPRGGLGESEVKFIK